MKQMHKFRLGRVCKKNKNSWNFDQYVYIFMQNFYYYLLICNFYFHHWIMSFMKLSSLRWFACDFQCWKYLHFSVSMNNAAFHSSFTFSYFKITFETLSCVGSTCQFGRGIQQYYVDLFRNGLSRILMTRLRDFYRS